MTYEAIAIAAKRAAGSVGLLRRAMEINLDDLGRNYPMSTGYEKTTDLTMKDAHISADNGQGMGLPHGCVHHQCRGWNGDTQWATQLRRDAKSGNWICPNCHASYGK